MAILKKRAELDGLDIPDAVMEYVANNIKSNIRELEGALNKICVYANLTKKNEPITVDIAEEALKDLISPDAKKEITPAMIAEIVASHYHITMDDLISKKKNKEIAYPRQITMYLCRKLTDAPLQTVGNMLGKRDHSTVIHGIEKIEKDLKNNQKIHIPFIVCGSFSMLICQMTGYMRRNWFCQADPVSYAAHHRNYQFK